MGFRSNAYATVWSVEPISDLNTKARISISKKNKNTGIYEEEFGGYVNFIGSAAASKAMSLKEKDRIRLGDVDLTTKYDKERKVTYYNPKIFSFETQTEFENVSTNVENAQSTVDSGEVDDSSLPF